MQIVVNIWYVADVVVDSKFKNSNRDFYKDVYTMILSKKLSSNMLCLPRHFGIILKIFEKSRYYNFNFDKSAITLQP